MKIFNLMKNGAYKYLENIERINVELMSFSLASNTGVVWVEFSMDNGDIHLVSMLDKKTEREFIWELNKSNPQCDTSIYLVCWQDVEDRLLPILQGREYTDLVTVELDFDPEELKLIESAAEFLGVSVNDFIVNALEESIKVPNSETKN